MTENERPNEPAVPAEPAVLAVPAVPEVPAVPAASITAAPFNWALSQSDRADAPNDPVEPELSVVPGPVETALLVTALSPMQVSIAPAVMATRTATGGGFIDTFVKHPRAWLFSALGVVFVLLSVGAVFAGRALGNTGSAASLDALIVDASPSPSPSPTPTARATPSVIPAAIGLRTCSVAAQAADSRLGTFSGSVINAKTGEVLFDRAAGTPTPAASVMKLITAAAALATIGGDYTFTTKVFAGTAPGSIVLVGGGDPTLNAGGATVYPDAPKLSDLAKQVVAAWAAQHPDPSLPGGTITSVVLDATMWNPADNWDPTWPAAERTLGFQPLITALMVDGDRQNSGARDSPRSTDPVGKAGAAFVTALGLTGVTVTQVADAAAAASATKSSERLGQVQSQPINSLIGQMLPNSDNTLAEMMARVVSKNTGGDGSQASLATKIPAALASYDIPTTGFTIRDGSGESNKDAVPPAYFAKLMVKVLGGANGLNVIYNALPVSGKTGTLATRFTGANAVARGAVNAKTGSILALYALSGIVQSKDGTPLAFAFFAGGKVSGSGARAGLDTVTTAVYTCGNNLSNN